jgi:hypothetical protein
MQLWQDLQGANWVSDRDHAEWRDRAIRAEAQTEVLLDLVKTALHSEVEDARPAARRRMRAV